MDEELAIKLFKAGIPIFGEFSFKLHEKYPDAQLFLMKFNLRMAPKGNLTEKLVEKVAKHLVKIVRNRNIQFDLAVGLPWAGEPLAKAFVQVWNNSYPEKKKLIFLEKEEALNQRRILPKIRGEFENGDIVLLIDDVISLADTKIEAIEVFKSHNLIATHCIVVMDWELGGRRILANYGLQLVAAYLVSELLYIWQSNNLLPKMQSEEIINRKNKIKKYIEKYHQEKF